MSTGEELLALARQHIGEKYVFGVTVPKDNAAWTGPWDCAELVSWCVYQVSQKLYGCLDDSAPPAHADAFTGAWQEDLRRLGVVVSVARAARTPGAVLLRFPHPGAIGHIVLSDGAGGTVEAMGAAWGVRAGKLDGRHWDTGVLVPWIEYHEAAIGAVPAPPTTLMVLGDSGAAVAALQRQLAAAGFASGEVDGVFGPHTLAAVTAFQLSRGLVPDGEVGIETEAALAALPAVPVSTG